MKVYSVINKFIENILSRIPNHTKGMLSERVAMVVLMLKGYKPLSINNREGYAEVDLIMHNQDTIVLVEVKYRKTEEDSLQAINPSQEARLKAQAILMQRQYPSKNVRIDGFFFFSNRPFFKHLENIFNA